MQVLYHQELTKRNTMALACIANKVILLESESDIAPVMAQVADEPNGFLVLSGGSNVILPKHLNKTVITPSFSGITVLSNDEQSIDIEIMAGHSWHYLVVECTQNGWYGLENLALIPGLVGAAPVQNIGAYGVQVEDYLTHVRAYHIPSGQWHTLDKTACQFGYRDSLFKREPNTWLISRVGFRLHKNPFDIHIDYGDVKTVSEQQAQSLIKINGSKSGNRIQAIPTPLDVMHAIISIRQSKLPDPNVLPNCGSYFQNPIISQKDHDALLSQYPNLPSYAVKTANTDEPSVKIPAAWLIDHAGLKGKGVYPILTHDKQALVLTNHTKDDEPPASQTNIAATQALIIDTVKAKYGICLHPEPIWVTNDRRYNQ